MGKPSKLDLLLIHVPKLNNFYNPFGYFIMNNIVSFGTFAIADWADQNGYKTQILHLGAELLFQKGFRLERMIREKQPLLIGLSCHWHYQVYDVAELARRIKEQAPNVKIVVGGYTASIFAEEILASQPAMDFVVRGESEVPVVGILDFLNGRANLENIPNLSYGAKGLIKHNPISFTADKRFLEGLTFCRLDLFPNYQNYLKYLSYPVYLRSYPKFLNYSVLASGRLEGYMVPTGRGCPANCQYCGGGKEAAKAHFGRDHTTLISQNRVLEDIARAKRFGVESLYFPFDPYPKSDYYPRLFRMIRENGLTFDATFESFALPTREFIDEFVATFGKGKQSQILLSPESGDEELRNQCKGYTYSNLELMKTLDYMEHAGAAAQISYAIGLPGETEKSLEQTRLLWQQISRRYKNVFLQTATLIDPDPASPAERQGMVPVYTLDGLLRLHKESHRHSYTGWTYLPIRHTCSALAQTADETYRRLQQYKCRYFCSYMVNDRLKIIYPFNRLLCILLGIFFRLIKRPLCLRDYV